MYVCVVSHEVEAAEGHERTEPKKDHDLDAIPLDRGVHSTQDAVALGAALRLLVQHVPATEAKQKTQTFG